MPGGRPSTFTEELGQEICDAVRNSPLMLEEICDKYAHFPCHQTIYRWRHKYPDFGRNFELAKQGQIEPLVSDMLSKIRKKENDFYEDSDGKKCVNYAALQRLRLEVDTIKWFAAKLAPKIYGTKSIEIGAEESFLEKIIDKL